MRFPLLSSLFLTLLRPNEGAVTSAERQLVIRINNFYRSTVSPPAANMLQLVSQLDTGGAEK